MSAGASRERQVLCQSCFHQSRSNISSMSNSRAPSPVARLFQKPMPKRHRLVEQRQVEILDVHKFELSVAALLRDFIDPLRYRLAISTRARASENDCYLYHIISYLRVLTTLPTMFAVCRSLYIVSSLAKSPPLSQTLARFAQEEQHASQAARSRASVSRAVTPRRSSGR